LVDDVTKHFVTFYSPGTFVSETDTKPVDSWDVQQAIEMAKSVHQRYGATPYGFSFSTRHRGPDDLDSKEVARSNFYWLGGKIETLEETKARNDPNDRILISNMEINGWDKCVVNTNSWKFTRYLDPTDVILDVDMRKEPANAASN